MIPPLDMEMARIAMNQHHVLRSQAVSQTWSHRQVLEATPIWLALSRSVAMTFSLSERNLVSIGESGMRQNTTME